MWSGYISAANSECPSLYSKQFLICGFGFLNCMYWLTWAWPKTTYQSNIFMSWYEWSCIICNSTVTLKVPRFANHCVNPADFSACCGVVNLLLMEKHDFSLPNFKNSFVLWDEGWCGGFFTHYSSNTHVIKEELDFDCFASSFFKTQVGTLGMGPSLVGKSGFFLLRLKHHYLLCQIVLLYEALTCPVL